MTTTGAPPDPGRILMTLNAYQQTFALRAALELDLFTHIAGGAATVSLLSERAQASERGIRILCDYLVVIGLLSKAGQHYALEPEAALFLNAQSPAYLGDGARFLTHDGMIGAFRRLAETVRSGRLADEGTLAPHDPIWVEFARSMAPMIRGQAQRLAPHVTEPGHPASVLDVAAGHGLFGLEVAAWNPMAQVVAVDWPNVLEVARENAAAYGVADRYRTIPGSAFDVDLGTGYDLVLLPNFVHHFDRATIVQLLTRIRRAIRRGGLLATVEFVPNEDRVTPPVAAAFGLMMLGTTPAGDVYTFTELEAMFHEAGFGESRLVSLDPTPQQAVLTQA
jgi:2-polyprenyl-3-methyl-5-hydroxy-6-metoxy-1,4-benzoquinol methylase